MRNQYVLLTCVGASDPVRGCHDGGMLHIMRHYRPYAVYLYISPEMKAEEERDNRYEKAFVRMRESWRGMTRKSSRSTAMFRTFPTWMPSRSLW